MSKHSYIERVKKPRNVWLNGELVDDLSEHPDFKGTVQTIVTLLEKQTNPQTKEILTYQTETGEAAHLSFLVPKDSEDLALKRKAYQYWADETFGVMSRLSEYTRSLITGWYANRFAYEKKHPGFAGKIARYYKQSRDNDWLSTVAGHDPQKDRFEKNANTQSNLLHIVKKNHEGIFVKGAKMIATAAPYVDEILINSYHKIPEHEREYANVFFVPVTAKGLHIICRESFADKRLDDHPLSARFDEMDAVLIFDNVFIPWERVLVCEDADFSWELRNDIASALLSQHQTVVRLISKLESVAAIGNELAETAGATQFLHVKEKLAELLIQVETIKALLVASETKSQLYKGILLPNKEFLATARNLGTKYYPRALEILQQIGAGGLLQTPSTLAEFDGAIAELLQEPFRGSTTTAKERTKLIKLAWDLIGSPLAARHELYERFYSGDPVRTFAAQYKMSENKQKLIDFAYDAIQLGGEKK
ncbi:4-hydroxyphenylacetate 3-hydroxylase family protein [Alkalihalobacillus sp. 1P02AB]|uniref:4-hydroxyphenylacetate 3-hydroxylase family protein n=1 Tax=Alkalihalobacillus sp. 1P02AB TaxID=3132260 RepID=UPI0039A6124A